MKKRKRTRKICNNPWFRKRCGVRNQDWGFIPINCLGCIALGLLVAINVVAAHYFNIIFLVLDSWIKFGVVFLLSMFVFILLAKNKTRNVENDL